MAGGRDTRDTGRIENDQGSHRRSRVDRLGNRGSSAVPLGAQRVCGRLLCCEYLNSRHNKGKDIVKDPAVSHKAEMPSLSSREIFGRKMFVKRFSQFLLLTNRCHLMHISCRGEGKDRPSDAGCQQVIAIADRGWDLSHNI